MERDPLSAMSEPTPTKCHYCDGTLDPSANWHNVGGNAWAHYPACPAADDGPHLHGLFVAKPATWPTVEWTADAEQDRAKECIDAGCIWYRHAGDMSNDVTRIAKERDELQDELARLREQKDAACKDAGEGWTAAATRTQELTRMTLAYSEAHAAAARLREENARMKGLREFIPKAWPEGHLPSQDTIDRLGQMIDDPDDGSYQANNCVHALLGYVESMPCWVKLVDRDDPSTSPRSEPTP